MMLKLTPLQQKLVGQLLTQARLAGWVEGFHVTEEALQPLFGTSRTPIRAAMTYLEQQGVFEKRLNQGFFFKALPKNEPHFAAQEDKIYFAIAMERLSRALPDFISESELMRRFNLSRAQLKLILTRITAEGWIERRQGHGWAFLNLIDTPQAYLENYRFRQMLEPALMRSPEFKVEKEKLMQLERQQRALLEGDVAHLTAVELFEINAHFHETLAQMGNNRFALQALMRLNQLRRLIEYSRLIDEARVRRVANMHLNVIIALKNNDITQAAHHLEYDLQISMQEKIERL